MLDLRRRKQNRYYVLREVAKLAGYSSDYIGWLIRKRKIKGRKVCSGFVWQTTEAAIKKYQLRKRKKILHLIPKSKFSFRNFPNFGRKKWDKVFYFASRFALAGFAVFFLVSGAAPIKLLQGSLITAINAINGEESKFINFYSSFSEGDPEGIPSGSYGASWQNPERAYGPPDVLPSGDLNSFSETNSAIYKTGPLNLILEKFETGENLENDNFQSAKIKFSFAIGEKKFDLELVPLATTTFATTTTEESTATSTETAATTTEATTTIETS
ncbi:hypothetical protein KJ636_01345, partial [Patescibacteria group bacterium]|nr:hypothetical protein [Patescibacteria group bacterium]